MNINNIHDNNGQLDNLFQSARNEAPKYAFTEASSIFTSALAIGVATAAQAKAFTSTIFKSKIFIMSISTITAITSAALIYSSVNSTEPSKVIAVEEGQPTKSTRIIETPEAIPVSSDDTLKLKNITKDSIKLIKIDVQDNIILAKVTMKDASVKVLKMNTTELDVSHLNLDRLTADLDLNFEEMDGLQFDMDNLQEMTLLTQIDAMSSMEDMLESETNLLFNLENENTKMITRFAGLEDEYKTVSFFVTQATTVEELEEIKKAATTAGIKFTYTAKVKKNVIKKLNLSMSLVNMRGGTERQCMNIRVSGSEMFSHTLQWQENDKGEAVCFNKQNCASKGSYTTARRIYKLDPIDPSSPPSPENSPNPEPGEKTKEK